ncbi:MAG TPA: T9SS type A sorting domain-containing protein [Bacteroidia bacterium]|nr:T9SS type A sorting domain-containing protein [Bacteroidales bacterium]HRS59861.1 T9SS type A sorting domain-containing protein [Bacteroidia bacterium]
MIKKNFIFRILLVATSTLFSPNSFAQGWTQKANFTIMNTGATGFAVNGKGYVYGGSINKNVEFDPIANTWTEKNPIPIKGANMISFVIGNKAYVGMPDALSGVNDTLYEYDPSTDSYTLKALYPGPKNLYGKIAFAVNNKGYVLLGNNSNKQLWEYNPVTNSWTQKATPIIGGHSNYAAFTINNKAYVSVSSNLYEYDPSTDTWATKSSLPNTVSRDEQRAFSIGNYGFVGGGGYLFKAYKDFYRYDPTTDSWSIIDSLPGPGSFGGVAFTIGNKGYFTLGMSGMISFRLETWEYYDPTITTGIEETSEIKRIMIMPNPNNGSFIIHSEKPAIFELTDITGKVINTYRTQGNNLQVNENLPAGMYFVREKETGLAQKIIVE